MTRRNVAVTVAGALLLGSWVGASPASPASKPAPAAAAGQIADDDPVDYTPNIVEVPDGENHVTESIVVNGTVYIGGKFNQIEEAHAHDPDAVVPTVNRKNFAAYDAATGAIDPLKLDFNGEVFAFEVNPTGEYLFVGGAFTRMNGVLVNGLAKVELATGDLDDTFSWAGGGLVKDLRIANKRLYVAGKFPEGVVAVLPGRGLPTNQVDLEITGSVTGAATKVEKIAISPDGQELVALGDFTRVEGFRRRMAFRATLTNTAAVLQGWHPQRFRVRCRPSLPFFLRDVEWSPDGTFFVIVSSGGIAGGYPETGFCDASGRWERSSTGLVAEPTWINWSGGDSFYSVAVSDAAVYVGGHMRWLDNPEGAGTSGPGAYVVKGLGVIDPTTGLVDRTWQALPMVRAHGKEDLALFPGGLVVSGDGKQVAGEYHYGTSLFPYCDPPGCP